MGVYSVTMKTHSKEDITDNHAIKLNLCKIHKRKPHIFKMIVGRGKETYYVANCEHDDCGKISYSVNELIQVWNKWNPASLQTK